MALIFHSRNRCPQKDSTSLFRTTNLCVTKGLLHFVVGDRSLWQIPAANIFDRLTAGRNPKQPPGMYPKTLKIMENLWKFTNLNWWVSRISGCHQQYLSVFINTCHQHPLLLDKGVALCFFKGLRLYSMAIHSLKQRKQWSSNKPFPGANC